MSPAVSDVGLPEAAPVSERFARLLRTEISDADPDAFGDNVEVVLALAREGGDGDAITAEDAKVLLRQLSLRHDAHTGNRFFALGIYQTFFTAIRARDEFERARLDAQMDMLAKTAGLLENPALTARSLRVTLVELWGALTEGLPEDDEEVPEARMLAWRLFESILRGVLQVDAFSTTGRTFHYGVLANSSRYRARLQDERRRILLEDFRFSVGDAYPRRPLLRRTVAQARALAPADRALLVQAITSSHPREVEPVAHVLRHHAWLLGCGQGESAAYFDAMEALLEHLLEAVLARATGEWPRVMRVYLTLIRERHLGPLRSWCAAMQRARRATPLLGDLLLEPYLLRAGLLRGAEEPGIAAMLWDWNVLQRAFEARLGYDGPPFDLQAAFRRSEQGWLEPAGGSDVSWERLRRTKAYDTFTQVPVVARSAGEGTAPVAPPAPTAPLESPAMLEGTGDAAPGGGDNPFEDDTDFQVTEPYPRLDEHLFDAITRQLPVLDDAVVDLSGGSTLVLPNQEGTALNRAATIILPASASGEPEPGLHQARTLLFPVQSVPITRNEAICRRVDLILRQAEGSGRRSAEVLRAELSGMPEEDRIIAEQYLAQIVEREMAWVSRRLRAADTMSQVTLDDYAGWQLSAVLRRFGVSGYLRRVFLSECVALYAEFLGQEGLDSDVADSLQLALFTVLNAHQDRLDFPQALLAELLALGGFSPEDPLPSRLPYVFPEPIQLPADLAARMSQTGSQEAVFEVEYLLESQVQELSRTVQKVSTLEIFNDLEVALGATGLTEEGYLDFVEELGARVRHLVRRTRGLFVHLEQSGAESRALEQTLLQLIGYGRTVWSGCVFPALAFFGKMAFGQRQG